MDLFGLFLGGAISAGFGKAIDVLVDCYKCDERSKSRIGNQQYNTIECGNCHVEGEQFTNACNFTIDPKTLQIGHAAVARTIKFEWTTAFLFFHGAEFKIPYRIYTAGLRNRPLVFRQIMRRYDDEKRVHSEMNLIKPISNSSTISLDVLYDQDSFLDKDRTILALDLLLESEHHDVVFEDRWLINPWDGSGAWKWLIG